jgi:hypothetical protein
MTKANAQEAANIMAQYLENIEIAKKATLKVGILSEDALTVYVDKETGEVGSTVLEVGAKHEFGTDGVPRRSFLRMPLFVKRKAIEKTMVKQFELVVEEGKSALDALGLVGFKATNTIIEAFETGGFGNWQDISQTTKDEKGSNGILKDTLALQNSIKSVVVP